MTIETRFDIPFVADLALREKQIQQNYRPIIAVHKWFARRPGTLFRALALSEFGDAPLSDIYFKSNQFPGLKVADPFMGGGTPLIEANRIGCDAIGFDINPMAAWIVREEIEHLDLDAYAELAERLVGALRSEVGELYVTDCPLYGDSNVPVKYFLWVKVIDCAGCGASTDLFPGYLLAEASRHPKTVLVCPDCGDLNEIDDKKAPGSCKICKAKLRLTGPAGRGRCLCRLCGHDNVYPVFEAGPPRHRLFAIEYHNPRRKESHKGRFFKKPDEKDLARVQKAEKQLRSAGAQFIPDQKIPAGDETGRLHRWGYTFYRQMFNSRQLLGLNLSCRLIRGVKSERIRRALATNLSDLLRYQNMLCRYDTASLKSLDIFSVHGFPVGLVQCESNLIGTLNSKNTSVGSGGWTNIIEKYSKAKRYCDAPFEVARRGARKVKTPIPGEWIGECRAGAQKRSVSIHCADSAEIDLPPDSLDAVFTDPPYFGNVQYGELMDFCYVWLRRLIGGEAEGFDRSSTRDDEELTGNVTKSRGLFHFTEGLARVYGHMAKALKPGAPLAFTFHHNKMEAYIAVGVAVLDSGLMCSASLPCPAEMGGSIHINGTTSSIIDTVFVCRSTGRARRRWLYESADELAEIVGREVSQLSETGRAPKKGDIRCIIFGHLTRMAVWNLRKNWNLESSTAKKLELFAQEMRRLADADEVLRRVESGGRTEIFPPAHKASEQADNAPAL